MVRIRSLAKELRHLEKQKQNPASTPPPSQSSAHTDPAEQTAAPLNPKATRKATPPQENDTAAHQSSPPAQTDEATSALSSSPSARSHTEGDAVPSATALRESGQRKKTTSVDDSSSESEEGGVDTSRSRRKDTTNLFALGGSRFDILMNGSYGDGAGCRKGEVRKATKVCSSGKAALQRSTEDMVELDGVDVRGEASHTGNNDETAEATPISPPPPPLGTSCGIPARFPFKRLLPQPFSHILVCDFEATCEGGSVFYPHEIIEFPVVVLDTATLRIVAEFHRYVKPVLNPKLTTFCTELTGITQEMVDQADTLPVVVAQFEAWLESEIYPLCELWSQHYGDGKLSHNLKSEQKRFVFDERTEQAKANAKYEAMICMATDGPWDMRRFMHECSVMRDGIQFPPVCYRYINVRHSYGDLFKCRQVKLTHMLRKMCMSFEGRRHSGIDDTRNITRVLAELMARGYRVHHVSMIKYTHRGDAFLASNQAAQELLTEFGETDKTHTSRNSKVQKAAAKRGKGKK